MMDGYTQTRKPAGDALLVTGATGFLGQEILLRYLERSERPIYTLIRAENDLQATERLRSILVLLFGDADPYLSRVSAVAADVESAGLGLDDDRREELASRVTEIIHSAASVSFTLPLSESRRVNVEGTRRLLEFAELCQRRGGGLRRFCHISTAYVAGDHEGEFTEDQLEVGQGFRNAYERSKFEAELLVRERSARLPILILRPSIVVGERSSGWTSSFNVLYPPLKAFARGAYPVIPARRSTPVDVVPVDYVADAVYELVEGSKDGLGVYHLVSGRRATTVGRLIEHSARYFRRRPPHLVSPPIYRRLLHPLLMRVSGERQRRALRRTESLFPYFSMRVTFDDRRARSRLERAGIRAPSLDSYFDRLLDFADYSRWGRSLPQRHESRPIELGSPTPAQI
jgi:thioester reductase-like protein